MVDNTLFVIYNMFMDFGMFKDSKNRNKSPERRLRIGFAGLAAGAGATTLAFSATEYLAARLRNHGVSVTMLELDPGADAPAGRAYDKVGIDRRFAGRDYFSFYKAASEGRSVKSHVNIDGGINWVFRVPGEAVPAPTAAVLLRLFNNVPGDIVVCDIPAYKFLNDATGRDALSLLLSDLDEIICIFDPLPSRLLASVPAAEACRAASHEGTKPVWVFNKFNPGADMREAASFAGVRNYSLFPAIPIETVYRAEYACRSLASDPEAASALGSLLKI